MNDSTSSDTIENYGFGRIRIVRVPDGDAPYDIRKRWVGLELTCAYLDRTAWTRRIFSNKPLIPRPGYWVNQDHAIRTLRQKDPVAADWWNTQGYPHTDESLWFFNAECTEVLIRPQSMHVIIGENN